MLDLDDSRRLDPGLAVHLNGNPLVTQDSDLHCSTLIRADRHRLDGHILICMYIRTVSSVFSPVLCGGAAV